MTNSKLTDAQIEHLGILMSKNIGADFQTGWADDGERATIYIYIQHSPDSEPHCFHIRPDGITFHIRGLTATVVND